MKKRTALPLACLVFLSLLQAQNRASMTAPVIKAGTEEVVFTSRFEDFVPGADYRIGVGTAGSKIANAKIELSKNDAAVNKSVVSFDQGYTDNWWKVDKVSAQGFVLSPAELPEKEVRLGLKVTLPRAEADKLKRLFIFVARKYGEDRWYIEDGAELNDTYW